MQQLSSISERKVEGFELTFQLWELAMSKRDEE
jgi:hypothetical protein